MKSHSILVPILLVTTLLLLFAGCKKEIEDPTDGLPGIRLSVKTLNSFDEEGDQQVVTDESDLKEVEITPSQKLYVSVTGDDFIGVKSIEASVLSGGRFLANEDGGDDAVIQILNNEDGIDRLTYSDSLILAPNETEMRLQASATDFDNNVVESAEIRITQNSADLCYKTDCGAAGLCFTDSGDKSGNHIIWELDLTNSIFHDIKCITNQMPTTIRLTGANKRGNIFTLILGPGEKQLFSRFGADASYTEGTWTAVNYYPDDPNPTSFTVIDLDICVY